jgi:hypothetical protein
MRSAGWMRWFRPGSCRRGVGAPPRRPRRLRRLRSAAAVLLLAAWPLGGAAPALAAGPGLPAPSSFGDLGEAPWAAPSVVLLAAQGVVQGVSPTSFAPDAPLTAEQAITFLSRIFPGTLSGAPSQPPSGVDPWAQAAVDWAIGSDVIQNPQALQPTLPAPRAQVVAWLVRALGLSGSTPPTFGDAADIPAQYAAEVGVAQADGLVQGDPQGDFDPSDPITRAQMAVILVRAERVLASGQAGTPGLFNWAYVQGSASQPLASGTVRTASAAMRIGVVETGSVQTQDGLIRASYVVSHGEGAGTLSVTRAGATATLPFAWKAPEGLQDGTLWIFAPDGTEGYAYMPSPQQVSFQGSPAARGLPPAGAVEVQPQSDGSVNATLCPGAGSCTQGVPYETYRGPSLPSVVLWLLDAAGGPELAPS